MSSYEETIDEVLQKVLQGIESGEADLEAAMTLSQAIKRAQLNPSEDMTAALTREDRNWWRDESSLRLRRNVSELLDLWTDMWPETSGFFDYSAGAIRYALAATPSRPGQPSTLGEEAQQFIEAELPKIALRMSEEWSMEIISLLPRAVDEGRAALLETELRAILRDQGSDSEFPEELLNTITTTATRATDTAFATWLSSFDPNPQAVWEVLLGMERDRWANVTDSVGKYIARRPRGQRDAFARKLTALGGESIPALLKGIDPSCLTQIRLAETQAQFLDHASNPQARHEALIRIQALALEAENARAKLVDQVFETAGKSDAAARDVLRHFPDFLHDAPGVRARRKALEKKVSPSIADRFKQLIGF